MIKIDAQEFGEEFNELCIKHDVQAIYVMVGDVDELGAMLLMGGEEQLCQLMEPLVLTQTVEYQKPRN